MLCTCIYFVDIGSSDGEDQMLPPPPDPVAELDEDAEGMMLDIAEDQQEAGADKRPALAGAPTRG